MYFTLLFEKCSMTNIVRSCSKGTNQMNLATGGITDQQTSMISETSLPTPLGTAK